MRGMFGAARRGSKAINRGTANYARQGMAQSRKVAKRALPEGTRRKSVLAGTAHTAGRRARVGVLGVGAAGLGMNAAVGPRGTTSGRDGLQGKTVGGGRGGF